LSPGSIGRLPRPNSGYWELESELEPRDITLTGQVGAMIGTAAILKVDPGGRPIRWISVEEAAGVIVAGRMLWSYGGKVITLHGGLDRRGTQSTLDVPGILAVTGLAHPFQRFVAPLCN